MKALLAGYTVLCPSCENPLEWDDRKRGSEPVVRGRCYSVSGGYDCALRGRYFTVPMQSIEIGEPEE